MAQKTDKSTPKGRQLAFAQRVLAGETATDAYEAVYKVKRSVADTCGPRLLGNARIQAWLAPRIEEVTEEALVEAKDVIRELKLIGFSNLDNYTVDPVTGKLSVAEGVPAEALRAVSSVEYTVVCSLDEGEGKGSGRVVKTKIRLWPKVNALEDLGKHLGILRDQVDVNVKSHAELVAEAARRAKSKGQGK